MILLMPWLLAASPAMADCIGPSAPDALVLDTASTDTDLPEFPNVLDVTLELLAGGSDGCDACSDAVEMVIMFGDTQDATTPSDDLGYSMSLVGGALPDGITLPSEPFTGPEARFVWLVDRAIAADDIFIQVEVRTIDPAGNASTGSVTVDILQPGLDIPAALLGCSQGRTGAPLALLAAVALARRRRDAIMPTHA